MEDGLKVRDRHTVVNFIDDYMRACVCLLFSVKGVGYKTYIFWVKT